MRIKQANNLMQNGRYEEAAEMYEKLQHLYPASFALSYNYELAKKLAKGIEGQPQPARSSLADCRLSEAHSTLIPLSLTTATRTAATQFELRCELGAAFPLLSIVVPCYNSGELLESTVKKMVSTQAIPFELIVVDDGSSDNSKPILEQLSNMYPNLTLISQENAGAGIARNRAISACRGEYTFFLDADDELDMVEMSKAVLHALTHGYDMLFLAYRVLTMESDFIAPMWRADIKCFRASARMRTQRELQRLAFESIGFPWNRIISTRLLQDKGVSFCPTPVHNDMLFHWQSICESRRIGFLNTVVCTHKKFSSGSLSSNRDRRRLAVFDAMEITHATLQNNKVFKRHRSIWNRKCYQTLDWNRSILNSNVRGEFDAALKKFKQRGIVDFQGSDSETSNRPYEPVIRPPMVRPLVTIITITKDILGRDPLEKEQNEAHFKQMMDSVLAQTYGRDAIEHIVVDGASADGTVELVMQCLNDGQLDKVISKPDTGIYNAMNRGVHAAKGQMLMFLNAHDYLSPHGIESLVTQMNKTGADYCFGNSITVDELNHSIGEHTGNIVRVLFGMPYCHQAAIFARHTFNKVMYPEDFKITTWKYAVELYLAGFEHAYCDEAIAYFRTGGLSTLKDHEHQFWGELRKIKVGIATNTVDVPLEIYDRLRTPHSIDLRNSPLEAKTILELIELVQSKGSLTAIQKDFFTKAIAQLRLDVREINE